MQLCPECRYKQGYFRATVEPTYRCRRCGHEWDLLLRCQECGHPRWGNTVHLDACLGCGTHFDPAYVLDVGYAEQRERKRLLRLEAAVEAIDIEERESSHRLRREEWLRAGGVRTDGRFEIDGRIVEPPPPPPLSTKVRVRNYLLNILLVPVLLVGFAVVAIGVLIFGVALPYLFVFSIVWIIFWAIVFGALGVIWRSGSWGWTYVRDLRRAER